MMKSGQGILYWELDWARFLKDGLQLRCMPSGMVLAVSDVPRKYLECSTLPLRNTAKQICQKLRSCRLLLSERRPPPDFAHAEIDSVLRAKTKEEQAKLYARKRSGSLHPHSPQPHVLVEGASGVQPDQAALRGRRRTKAAATWDIRPQLLLHRRLPQLRLDRPVLPHRVVKEWSKVGYIKLALGVTQFERRRGAPLYGLMNAYQHAFAKYGCEPLTPRWTTLVLVESQID